MTDQRRDPPPSPSRRALLAGAALAMITVSPALAADLPAATYSKAPVYVPPVYNWTGFYIGGHIGGGWSDFGSTEVSGTPAFPVGTAFTKSDLSGFLGGVQGGYNWQASTNLVIGVEGEYSWADVTGTATTVSTVNGFSSTVTAKEKNYALATGRLGYAADNWLFYAKGGGAWGQTSSSGTGVGTFVETTSSSTNRSGWVVGVGAEWGFAPNWSAKLEYNHIDFGTANVTILGTVSGISTVSSSATVDVVKAGVNYRFNWGAPVVAKY